MPALKHIHSKQPVGGIPDRVRSLGGVHFNVFAAATVAAFAHTLDELRIGELIAGLLMVGLGVTVAFETRRVAARTGGG